MAEDKTTRKVTVVVGPRPNGGVWGAGIRWPVGSTDADVTEEQLHKLAARQDLTVFEDGAQVKSEGPAAISTSKTLSPDEVRLLEEYRGQRSRDPKVADKYGGVSGRKLVKGETSLAEATKAAKPPEPPPEEDLKSGIHPRNKK